MTSQKYFSYIFFLVLLSGICYFSTLAPTIFYRDSPEFINTAYTLGISHPAGFPFYNLLAKALTFLPLGSIAFRVNLFSALMGCLTIAGLFLLTFRFMRILFGDEVAEGSVVAAFIPTALLAICQPFWWNAMTAEVYSLQALLTVVLIYCLLAWKQEKDIRYLYAAALTFGLSSGNHATVALYLPAILFLFFWWNSRKALWQELTVCIVLFLVGLSVYVYLPIRSLAEPSFDWGNPETVKGFFFQVTDRKDAHTHFSTIRQGLSASAQGALPLEELGDSLRGLFGNLLQVVADLLKDLWDNFHPLACLGFLSGGLLCFRKNKAFFVFFLILVGGNAIFFHRWGSESFFPTYIVASLFTSAMLGFIFHRMKQFRVSQSSTDLGGKEAGMPGEKKKPEVRWEKITCTILALAIPWGGLVNYPKVDRSRNYQAESLARQVYLSLEDRSVFVPGLSWFRYFFEQDVSRLRDDVTSVPVWDLLSPYPPSMLTSRRYPDLRLPESGRFDFQSSENIAEYAEEFFKANSDYRPIMLEQSSILYEQTRVTEKFLPYKNVLLKFNASPLTAENKPSGRRIFNEFKILLEEDLKSPESGRDKDWIILPVFWVQSFRSYFHDTGQWQAERDALLLGQDFLGYQHPEWRFFWIDNLLQDGKPEQARSLLEEMKAAFPNHFLSFLAEGLVDRVSGRPNDALAKLDQAVQLNHQSFRAHLERFVIYRSLKDSKNASRALQAARENLTQVRQLGLLARATASQ